MPSSTRTSFNERTPPRRGQPVTLFINDYNTEQAGKQGGTRARGAAARPRRAGRRVGHQFHVSLSTPVATLEEALAAFADLPVTQAVTELDVTTGTPVTQAKLIEQGYYYRDAFRIFRAHADDLFSVTAVGPHRRPQLARGDGAPLLFDDS